MEKAAKHKFLVWDRTGFYWALGGICLGFFDAYTLKWLGIDMRYRGNEATWLVGAYFAVAIGMFGYVIGRLITTRRSLLAADNQIRRQLKELDESREQARRNERLAAVGRLATGVAHEVRNPLGVIRSSAGLIAEDPNAGAENNKAARFIGEEVTRLNDFVTRLLDFTKPILPVLRQVDLGHTMQAVIHLVNDRIKKKQLQVHIDGLERPIKAPVDEDLLSRALLGLLVNATQAVEPGGRIEIRIARNDRDLVFEVADSGPGIDPEQTSEIMEPFVTTKPQGTGLGLPMAIRIAEAHGGDLHIRHNSGAGEKARGACFCLRLPLEVA